MAYKTILVHLDQKEKTSGHIRVAASLAREEEAYLVGAAMIGFSTQTFREARISEKDPALAAHLKFLTTRAEEAVAAFVREAHAMGVSSYEGRVVDGEAAYGISMQARYADLVVVARTSPDEEVSVVSPDLPEFAVIHTGRPVLLVPPAYGKDRIGKKALVSWNASKEARRALTDALPLLRRASEVEVAMFNVDAEPDMRDEASVTDLAVYLARHGVNVHVLRPQQVKHVGQALLDTAAERGADFLVLGGYGHTRFRQLLLGGVTRTVLQKSPLPVLMSH